MQKSLWCPGGGQAPAEVIDGQATCPVCGYTTVAYPHANKTRRHLELIPDPYWDLSASERLARMTVDLVNDFMLRRKAELEAELHG